ncbi:hypothetical protein HK101_000855 [Irineochytrium annulatum]|nr:hypothetical protein HK101_000855 [Irineochytrium annulatum]
MSKSSRSFPFASAYVRKVVAERSEDLVASLKSGVPYVQREFAAVVMIDISGYSTLTSNLSTLGKLSSEIITTTVGGYLNKIIDTVYLYGGDIVKFLGDAVLVTFSRWPSADGAAKSDADTRAEIVRRATLCSLHVMTRWPLMKVDMPSQWHKLQQSVAASVSVAPVPHVRQTVATTYNSSPQGNGFGSGDRDFVMRLHVAITAGEVDHVIIGVPSVRMDYFVHGDFLSILGDVIDDAKSGELGLSTPAWNLLCKNGYSFPIAVRQGEHNVVVPAMALLDLHDHLASFAGVSSNLRLCVQLNDQPSSSIDFRADIEIARAFTGGRSNEMASRDLGPGAAGVEALLQKFLNQSTLYRLGGGVRAYSALKLNDGDGVEAATKLDRGKESAANAGAVAAIASEFRTVTVLFAKLKSTFDLERTQKNFTHFLQALQKYDGVFQQYSMDDKGQTLLAFFGLPPLAQAQDTVNCMRASAMFSKAVKAGNLGEVTIAVATGDLLLTQIGTESRRESSFLGDSVNVAARLLGLHLDHHSILCDEPTRSAAHGVALVDLGQHAVKGKSAPIGVYGLDAASFPDVDNAKVVPIGAGTGDGFVGYRAEREALTAVVDEWVERPRFALALVEGASGLGKSRLLDYIGGVLRDRDISFSLTQGSEVDQWTPYAAISSVVTYIYNFSVSREADRPSVPDLRHQDSKQSLQSQGLHRRPQGNTDPTTFLRTYGESLDLAPLLPLVIPGVKVPDNDATRGLDGKARRSLIVSMVARVVERFTAHRNVFFLFDDTQWFDPVSLEVLSVLTKNCSRTCFMFFSRPTEDVKGDVLKQIRSAEGTRHVQLQGFAIDDVEELIALKFRAEGVHRVEGQFKQAVFDRSAGSPLVADMMIESMRLKSPDAYIVTEGTLHFASPTADVDEVLAKNVSAAITVQLDRIDPAFYEYLRHAAVLGQYFNLDDAAGLMPTPVQPELSSWLQTLDRFQFLVWGDVDATAASNGEYLSAQAQSCAFRHIAIRDTIYESLSYKDRSELHLKAAMRFESMLDGGSRDFLLPVVSFHFSRSDDAEKNIRYLEELGDIYLKKFLFHECRYTQETLLLFVRTIDVADPRLPHTVADALRDSNRLALWHAMFALSLAQIRDFEPAFSEACHALQLTGTPWPVKSRESVEMRRAAIMQWKLFGRTRGGEVAYKKHPVLDHPMRLAAIRLTNSALFICQAYHPDMFSPDAKGMILFWNMNLAIKIATEDPANWATFCLSAAFGFSWKMPWLAKIFIKKAEAVERTHGSIAHGAFHYYGMILLEGLRFKESAAAFEKVVAASRRTGDLAAEFCAHYYISFIHWLAGDVAYGVETLTPKLEAAYQLDLIWPSCGVSILLRTALIMEDLELAKRCIERLGRFVETTKIPYFIPPHQMGKAWVCLNVSNDPSAALQLYVEMADVMKLWNGCPKLTGDKRKVHPDDLKMLSVSEAKVLLDATARIRDATRLIGQKMFMGVVELMHSVYDAAYVCLKSKAAGLNKLRGTLSSIRVKRAADSGDIKLVVCLISVIVSVYTDDPTDRERSRAKAQFLLQELDLPFFKRWLLGPRS